MKQAQSVIPHIIDQHAEEAAFLWLLRHNAVYAPHYNLKDLTKLDVRVEAHIDGLRIAGDYGWEACYHNLEFKERGEVFTAAICRSVQKLISRHRQPVKALTEISWSKYVEIHNFRLIFCKPGGGRYEFSECRGQKRPVQRFVDGSFKTLYTRQ